MFLFFTALSSFAALCGMPQVIVHIMKSVFHLQGLYLILSSKSSVNLHSISTWHLLNADTCTSLCSHPGQQRTSYQTPDSWQVIADLIKQNLNSYELISNYIRKWSKVSELSALDKSTSTVVMFSGFCRVEKCHFYIYQQTLRCKNVQKGDKNQYLMPSLNP